MKQLYVRGRLENVMEEEEAFWFLFDYFRDNPGQGLPILMYGSEECDDLLISLLGHGCMDGFYVLKEVGDKLARDGVVRQDSPDREYDEERKNLEAMDEEEYLQIRAK
jgi:hypothetical protein